MLQLLFVTNILALLFNSLITRNFDLDNLEDFIDPRQTGLNTFFQR